ncbi:MAG: hypothetical protein ACE5FH_13235 [Candidatus Zixiibacteriota bacterium]
MTDSRLCAAAGHLAAVAVAMMLGIVALSGAVYADDSDSVATAPKEALSDSARIAALDSGVDTLDISKYSKEMQEKYPLVVEKCSGCHSMARVLNTDFALPDEWKRYIKRMRRKPGSKIKKKDAKVIWEFLVYDSEQRKPELIKQKLAADSAAARK